MFLILMTITYGTVFTIPYSRSCVVSNSIAVKHLSMVFASKHEPRPCYEPVFHLNGHWSGGCCQDYAVIPVVPA